MVAAEQTTSIIISSDAMVAFLKPKRYLSNQKVYSWGFLWVFVNKRTIHVDLKTLITLAEVAFF
jgi:hypothetical protein